MINLLLLFLVISVVHSNRIKDLDRNKLFKRGGVPKTVTSTNLMETITIKSPSPTETTPDSPPIINPFDIIDPIHIPMSETWNINIIRRGCYQLPDKNFIRPQYSSLSTRESCSQQCIKTKNSIAILAPSMEISGADKFGRYLSCQCYNNDNLPNLIMADSEENCNLPCSNIQVGAAPFERCAGLKLKSLDDPTPNPISFGAVFNLQNSVNTFDQKSIEPTTTLIIPFEPIEMMFGGTTTNRGGGGGTIPKPPTTQTPPQQSNNPVQPRRPTQQPDSLQPGETSASPSPTPELPPPPTVDNGGKGEEKNPNTNQESNVSLVVSIPLGILAFITVGLFAAWQRRRIVRTRGPKGPLPLTPFNISSDSSQIMEIDDIIYTNNNPNNFDSIKYSKPTFARSKPYSKEIPNLSPLSTIVPPNAMQSSSNFGVFVTRDTAIDYSLESLKVPYTPPTTPAAAPSPLRGIDTLGFRVPPNTPASGAEIFGKPSIGSFFFESGKTPFNTPVENGLLESPVEEEECLLEEFEEEGVYMLAPPNSPIIGGGFGVCVNLDEVCLFLDRRMDVMDVDEVENEVKSGLGKELDFGLLMSRLDSLSNTAYEEQSNETMSISNSSESTNSSTKPPHFHFEGYKLDQSELSRKLYKIANDTGGVDGKELEYALQEVSNRQEAEEKAYSKNRVDAGDLERRLKVLSSVYTDGSVDVDEDDTSVISLSMSNYQYSLNNNK